MKLAIILGTTRLGRQSEKVARSVQQAFQANPEVEIKLLDIVQYAFPVFEERLAYLKDPHPDLVSFSESLQWAEAIVFVIPEYNGSLPGTFKNAFDHFHSEYKRKPMGVVCVSDGKFGGVQASLQLQTLILHVFGYPMPLKLLVPNVSTAYDDQGMLIEPNITRQLDRFVTEFLWFADAIVRQKMIAPIQ